MTPRIRRCVTSIDMTSSTENILERLTAHNAKIPFNAWLGIEVLAASAESVELRVPWRYEFGGAPGMTHGGILASLVDTSAFLVLLAAKGTGGPTVDLQIDFHRSTANGALLVRSSLLRAGASISTIEVRISDQEQRLIATGRCVFLSRSRPGRDQVSVQYLDAQRA
jgi:1,4-dihydroxy-2-naphthoyl-CoA hydrolase